MAFGFTPKFEQDLDLNGLDPQHYLAIALDTVKQLGWTINYISKSGFIAFISGGLFKSMEQFQIVIHDTKVFITSKNATSGMVDWGKNKKHVEEFTDAFINIQSSLSEKQLDEKIKELLPVFESDEVDKLALPPANFNDNVKSFASIFIPRPQYFITPIIIDINILVFVLMVISGVSFFEPSTKDLIAWGANLRGITLSGQSWRLITNTFLHIGVFHIVLNMYALLYIGLLLEPYLGRIKFATAYLLTGIVASLTSIYWHSNTVSAGASGAIFGMYGVFLALLTTNFIDKSARKPLLISIGVFVLFNLMNGMKGGIYNAAHIGGLTSGLIIGYSFYPSLKRPSVLKLEYVTIALLAIVVLSSSFIVYNKIPNDFAKYDADMKDFAGNEAIALSVFKLGEGASKDDIITALREKGIVNWNKNLLIVNDMDKLDLPSEFAVRDYKLKQYCNLRIRSYGYITTDIEENTKKYQDSIVSCNIQIRTLINDLKTSN